MSTSEKDLLPLTLKKIGNMLTPRFFYNALAAAIREKEKSIIDDEQCINDCDLEVLPELNTKLTNYRAHLMAISGNDNIEEIEQFKTAIKEKKEEIKLINEYVTQLKENIKIAKEELVQLEAKKKIMGMASKRGFFQMPQYRLEVGPESDKKHLSQKTKPPASPKMRT